MWLTKYFNKKQSEEDLLINHLKLTYDFDEVILIEKKDPDFLTSLNLLASLILEKGQATLGIFQVDPILIEKLINEINSAGDYSIIKFSRKYVMSTSYYYAVLSKNLQGYTIPFPYITDKNLFFNFPQLPELRYSYFDNLVKFKSYRILNNDNVMRIIPSHSIRFPLKDNGQIEYFESTYRVHDQKETCSRDLEVVIDIETVDETINYSFTLMYGLLVLKEKKISTIPSFQNFISDFLFPYNMKHELIIELGMTLPFQFTPEFLKSMDDDFKLTVDMLKI